MKDFRVMIAGRGAGGSRKAERSVASVGGIVLVVNLLFWWFSVEDVL